MASSIECCWWAGAAVLWTMTRASSSVAVLLLVVPLMTTTVDSTGEVQQEAVLVSHNKFFHSSIRQRNVTNVSAAFHNAARLPCNLSSPGPDDSPRLVLWYRGDLLEPIYSYDARGVPFEAGTPWSSDERMAFQFISAAGQTSLVDEADSQQVQGLLRIDRIEVADAGVYRCRVDYTRSPATDYLVHLDVHVPPSPPTVKDAATGNTVPSVAGPFNVGDNLHLVCESADGHPQPRLTWWRKSELIDDGYAAVAGSRLVTNEITVSGLGRNDLLATFTCQASNGDQTGNLMPPSSTVVTIDMNLPPVSVEILDKHRPMAANREQQVRCRVLGSRPPPTISWWLDSAWLPSTRQVLVSENNGTGATTSTLTFTPTVSDTGKQLRCQAENRKAKGSAKEDVTVLRIEHKPLLDLKLGRNIRTDNIAVNDDAYFDCIVTANPAVDAVWWKHDGKLLRHDPTNGVILANRTLVLQRVQRDSAGEYTCSARNSEGLGQSEPYSLRIKFAPECKTRPNPKIFWVALGEIARVECDVESNPPIINFEWSYNSSAENQPVMRVPATQYKSDEQRSTLEFTPVTDYDFGSLQCLAYNSVGKQEEACVFQIRRAEKPEVVTNCSAVEQQKPMSVVRIQCQPGYDGGLPQVFHLEVFSSSASSPLLFDTALMLGIAGQQLLVNLSMPAPTFTIKGLEKGQQYYFVIYSSNPKGPSTTNVTLAMKTEEPVLKEVSSEANGLHERRIPATVMTLVLLSVATVAACLVAALLVAAAWCHCRTARGLHGDVAAGRRCWLQNSSSKGGSSLHQAATSRAQHDNAERKDDGFAHECARSAMEYTSSLDVRGLMSAVSSSNPFESTQQQGSLHSSWNSQTVGHPPYRPTTTTISPSRPAAVSGCAVDSISSSSNIMSHHQQGRFIVPVAASPCWRQHAAMTTVTRAVAGDRKLSGSVHLLGTTGSWGGYATVRRPELTARPQQRSVGMSTVPLEGTAEPSAAAGTTSDRLRTQQPSFATIHRPSSNTKKGTSLSSGAAAAGLVPPHQLIVGRQRSEPSPASLGAGKVADEQALGEYSDVGGQTSPSTIDIIITARPPPPTAASVPHPPDQQEDRNSCEMTVHREKCRVESMV